MKMRNARSRKRRKEPTLLVLVREGLDQEALSLLLQAALPEVDWAMETSPAGDWRAAVQRAAALPASSELVCFSALPSSLPILWLDRLRSAWQEGDQALSCLGAALPLPVEFTAQRSDAEIDSLCALVARARRWELSPATQVALVYSRGGVCSDSPRLLCLAQLYMHFAGLAATPPAMAFDLLADLRLRWPKAELDFQPAWPGVADKPVLLHVLHEWGGGIERFALDLAEADTERVHLGLRARGRWSTRCYGEALELCLLPSDLCIRRWPLLPAIGSASLGHPGYRRVLQSIVNEFAVSGVLVSSLIGHSLDVLDLPLPTMVIGHDYFPLWPELHCNFGDELQRFDAQTRQQTVLALPRNGLFGEREPAFWQQLYEAYAQRLLAGHIQLTVPSDSVRRNLNRLVPKLGEAVVVPHGLRPWPAVPPRSTPDFDEAPLRLLVLGRIDGGKGLELLRGALPELTRHADLHLLGCGKAGEELFGVSGVHIELDYPNAELPERIARIRPHAALLLSTVAESFSYTLSEIWSLGVVPIATRTGAFAERITDGRTGMLFSPDSRALVAIVRHLARDRSRLKELHATVAGMEMRSSHSMAIDYQRLFVLEARQRVIDWSHYGPEDDERIELLGETLVLRNKVQAQSSAITDQQVELERRASWGFDLDLQLQQRTAWALTLEKQLQVSREQCDELQQHANAVESQSRLQLAALNEALAESEQRRAQQRERARKQLREERRVVRRLSLQIAVTTEQMHKVVTDQSRQLEVVVEQLARLASEHARVEHEVLSQLQASEDMRISLLGQLQAQEFAHADLLAQLQRLEATHSDVTDQLVRSEAHRMELINSRSWQITAPFRLVSNTLRHLYDRICFRMKRLRGLSSRALASVRYRGWRATARRVWQERHRAAQQNPVVSTPVPSEQFGALTLPIAEKPRVSIIIPVYGKLAYTITCLKSIAATSYGFAIEVIVVDDCSPDDSVESLRRIGNLRLICNQSNLGFIGACNAGAAAARGDYLCFLNNDTAVQPGWLDAMMSTFDVFPDCGLVGAKLIYPDGRLQEAGGIIFSDGAGWNYGRFADPSDPRYDYPREADYCSGAAIAISRELFEELGGFDSHYAPAYYEDTDLAFQVRARGLKVYYQSAACVVHYEGISSGTDTSSGVKRYQLINHEKFQARWAEALKAQPVHDGDKVGLSCEHRVVGRILVIDATTPTPDQDSGSVRLMNLLRLLVDAHWKVVFFPDNRAYVPSYTEKVKALGVEVQHHPWLTDPVAFLRERGSSFDAVLICRHYIAVNYLPLVRQYCTQAKFIFDTVDLHYLREQRAAEVEKDDAMRRQAEATRRQELAVIGGSDVTVVVSPVEKELLAQELPGARVEILSNIHEISGRRCEFADRNGIFFVGGFQHVPNVDAVLWFTAEVWGKVHERLPELEFHIVGSKMPAEVEALARVPGVVIEGFVESLEPFLDGCRLAVAPLRYGAGVKGKVNSSMAHGQPVVMTSVAAEGMFLQHGIHGLIADEPVQFADEIVRLYQDEELWTAISDAGLRNVEENFSMQTALDALRSILPAPRVS